MLEAFSREKRVVSGFGVEDLGEERLRRARLTTLDSIHSQLELSLDLNPGGFAHRTGRDKKLALPPREQNDVM